MATANAVFQMPQEPHPLPSLESDEESFVVLGQSIPDASTDMYSEPSGLSVIAEAKRLIKSELDAIEQTKTEQKKESLDANKDVSDQNQSSMESSTALPELPFINKGFETTNTISMTSFSTEMSSVEVQTKIDQLIEENVNLKETVLQNNMSLKSQYERIVAWQEDVQKVHQAHKEKLMEAKSFIENYKKENIHLKRELAKFAEKCNDQEKQVHTLKNELKEKNTVTNEVLVKRSDDNIKEFQLDVANKKIKDLEAQLNQAIAENKRLKDEVADTSTQEEHSSKQIHDLGVQLEKLILENKSLMQEEKQIKNQEEINNEKTKELESELKRAKGELIIANRNVEELKNEISSIKTLRAQKEEAFIMTTNSLKAQLEMMASQPEEIANLRTQLVQIQTTLTQVEFSRAQAYSQVSQLTQELSNVRNQMEAVQSQDHFNQTKTNNEEVFVLQTQLDLYKADFEEERRAREVIKEEKDRLEEDLQNIQRRNQQLQEEIELLRGEMLRGERDYVVYPPHSSPQRSERSARQEASAPPTATGQTLRCPKCNFGFNNIQTLESHVHRCLDLDDRLP